MDEKLIARFWSKVDKDGPVPAHVPRLGPCWQWTGGVKDKGYGRLNYLDPIGDPRHMLAHRIAWFLEEGPVLDNARVLHKCDNPSCVNPSHLFIGSQLDNIADMHRKGRGRGLRHASGSGNNAAKLNEEAVRDIRSRHASGEAMWRIARSYEITRQNVRRVVRRETWRHVA